MALRMIRGSHEGSAQTSDRSARKPGRPRLRLVPGKGLRRPQPRPVAEVLSDGTVRRLDGARAWETTSPSGWRQGSLSGDGWTLWWERRAWVPGLA